MCAKKKNKAGTHKTLLYGATSGQNLHSLPLKLHKTSYFILKLNLVNACEVNLVAFCEKPTAQQFSFLSEFNIKN